MTLPAVKEVVISGKARKGAPALPPPFAGGPLTGQTGLPVGIVAASGGALMERGACVIANNGAGLVEDKAGALVGKAKDPAAGVIANHGGSFGPAVTAPVIPRYGLLAAGQKPLGGFRVAIVDAAGTPVADAAGKPYEATTNLLGQFTFAFTPRGRNLLVRLELPDGLGQLYAFLPDRPPGVSRQVEVEGVGTHILAYTLDRIVKGDQARLDRVTGELEATARAEAEAALAAVAKGVVTADSLEAGKLVATVGVWRELSNGFDESIRDIEDAAVAP